MVPRTPSPASTTQYPWNPGVALDHRPELLDGAPCHFRSVQNALVPRMTVYIAFLPW